MLTQGCQIFIRYILHVLKVFHSNSQREPRTSRRFISLAVTPFKSVNVTRYGDLYLRTGAPTLMGINQPC